MSHLSANLLRHGQIIFLINIVWGFILVFFFRGNWCFLGFFISNYACHLRGLAMLQLLSDWHLL